MCEALSNVGRLAVCETYLARAAIHRPLSIRPPPACPKSHSSTRSRSQKTARRPRCRLPLDVREAGDHFAAASGCEPGGKSTAISATESLATTTKVKSRLDAPGTGCSYIARLEAGSFMTDLVRRDVLHHGEKLMWDEHRRARFV